MGKPVLEILHDANIPEILWSTRYLIRHEQKDCGQQGCGIKKMAEEGRAFDDNQSECNFDLFIKFLSKTEYKKSCN